ncbi:MAG: PQQ-binding-like beta-propeller repeat protein [Verrucomicrobiales bacterium]|nr:PQQ-binding-like beta-propeller repeat protein [Verrucomicrobiales bacterium]
MRLVLLLPLLTCLTASLPAEDWPMWRGPRLDGTSLDTGFPTTTEGHTTWRVPVPGSGHASPIVFGDRIYLVSSLAETEERVLQAFSRADGALTWQSTVLKSPLEGKHRLNSHASSTPACDGQRLFTAFLDRDEVVISAHDLAGQSLWQVRPGPFASKHGFSSSPILFEDLVIVNCDHDGPGFIVALEAATGTERWRIVRPNNTRSYCVPMIREMAGRTQMVLSGTKCVTSYDPRTGELLWIIDGPTEQFVASLVFNEKTQLLYMTGGFPEHHLLAIRPDGSGNVTDTHIVWRTNQGVAYVPSPITVGRYLLIVSDSGIAHCFDAAGGDLLWKERFREHHASQTTAEGLVQFIGDDGTLRVVRPGPSYDLVAESTVGGPVFASPALSEGQIFIRTDTELICLGQRRSAPAP